MKTVYSTLLVSLFIFINFCISINFVIGQDIIKYPTRHKINLENGSKRTLLLLPPELNTVEISNLEVGEKYLINLNKDDVVNACSPEISLYDENNNKISFFSSYEFTAYAHKLTVTINPNCITPYNSRLSLYISVAKRSGTPFKTKETRKNNRILQGPLVGTSGLSSTESLIKDIFLGDTTIKISNISSFGGAQQIGQFESGASSIQMESGVLLTSGACSVASGPNNAGGATGGGGGGSDPDLLSITKGAPIFDAAGIEFDFITSYPTIQFNYVFGSEEYEEYTCSQFNDVFGLFIKDNTTNKNIALIPGTNLPVKINYVNQGSVGAFGNIANCSDSLGSLNYSGFYVSNPLGGPDVQYDGFTTVLTARAKVEPCKKYHLKMVIGDAGDAVFDSGVFLEAKSFSSGANFQTEVYSISAKTDTLYESCNSGFIHFKRINDIDLDQDLIVPLDIDSSSTAIEGIDYDTLPAYITIPAGIEEFILPIHIIKDSIPEATKSIKFIHSSLCSSGSNYLELFIKDAYAINIDTSSSYICENDSIGSISVKPSGGIGAYSYLWSNGYTSQKIQVLAADPPHYLVTVTDACGNTAATELSVKTAPLPTATIQGSGTLCPDHEGEIALEVNFTGIGPWTLNYLRSGYPQPPINNITTNPYTLLVWQFGNYTIASVEANYGCKGLGTGVAIVDSVTTALIPIVIDTTICYKDTIIINKQKISKNATVDFYQIVNNKCVNYIYHVSIAHTADTLLNLCTGSYVTIANQSYSKGGEYVANIPQASGCDSVIYISIKEHPKYQKINNITIGKGNIFKGFVINMDTTFVENLSTIYGCDSLVITHVKIATATNNLLNNYAISASPNPATKQLSISADNLLTINKWSVIDLLGFKVLSSDKAVALPLIIDITRLSSGYYWWVGENEFGKAVVSFIKITR